MGKLEKFRENETFSCLYQPDTMYDSVEPFLMRGKWSDSFGNERPIILEAGCGQGTYTLDMAERHPELNYIGMDIKGARIWHGAKLAELRKTPNVRFLRARSELCGKFFAGGEISGIWLTFPDPNVKNCAKRRRFMHPFFLSVFSSFLKRDGSITLKTDSDFLFEYGMDIIKKNSLRISVFSEDVHSDKSLAGTDYDELTTVYEKRFMAEGKKIKLVSFHLDGKKEFTE